MEAPVASGFEGREDDVPEGRDEAVPAADSAAEGKAEAGSMEGSDEGGAAGSKEAPALDDSSGCAAGEGSGSLTAAPRIASAITSPSTTHATSAPPTMATATRRLRRAGSTSDIVVPLKVIFCIAASTFWGSGSVREPRWGSTELGGGVREGTGIPGHEVPEEVPEDEGLGGGGPPCIAPLYEGGGAGTTGTAPGSGVPERLGSTIAPWGKPRGKEARI